MRNLNGQNEMNFTFARSLLLLKYTNQTSDVRILLSCSGSHFMTNKIFDLTYLEQPLRETTEMDQNRFKELTLEPFHATQLLYIDKLA